MSTEGTAKFLGPFQIVDELDEGPSKEIKEDTDTIDVEVKSDRKQDISEEEESKIVKIPKIKTEVKEDSISVSYEDESSVRSRQDNLTIDLHEESDIAVSENVDNCDKEDEDEEPNSSHPYSFMIENFELTKEQKIQTKIGPPKSLAETPVRIVNSRTGLLKLLPVLNSAKEIALRMQNDVNHFEINIELLAISTRDTDYIIDVPKLNRELLLLTEIFINPKIVKIIYCSKKILGALQNMLHLYLVNIFDCQQAGKALGTDYRHIDQILLKEYSYKNNPKIKNAHFCSRPLSRQMQEYCRVVPHYLIYMYHDYKNKLLGKDEKLYKELMDEFRETSKMIYPNFMQTKLLSLEEELQNRHKCQLEVLEILNEWRNDTAVNLKKNPAAIITKTQLITLSSILPVTEFSVCCISNSTFVNDDVEKILAIIREAKRKYNLDLVQFPISSKKRIGELKPFLLRELAKHTSGLNADRKMNNQFEKTKGKKIDEFVIDTKRDRPGQRQKMKSQQNTNSPGCNYVIQAAPIVIQGAPVSYGSQKACTSKDSSNNRNCGIGSTAKSKSLATSDSYNELEIQKRINTLKRKLSGIHEGTDDGHSSHKKRS